MSQQFWKDYLSYHNSIYVTKSIRTCLITPPLQTNIKYVDQAIMHTRLGRPTPIHLEYIEEREYEIDAAVWRREGLKTLRNTPLGRVIGRIELWYMLELLAMAYATQSSEITMVRITVDNLHERTAQPIVRSFISKNIFKQLCILVLVDLPPIHLEYFEEG